MAATDGEEYDSDDDTGDCLIAERISKKKRSTLSGNNQEEEENGNNETRQRKRRKEAGVSTSTLFLDDEAAEDEEDEEKRLYSAEDIRKQHMDEDSKEIIQQQNNRRVRENFGFWDDKRSVAEIVQEIDNRHHNHNIGMMSNSPARMQPTDQILSNQCGARGGPEPMTTLAMQSLMPSVSNPRLWMISCSKGKEQELVVQILNKRLAMMKGHGHRQLGISAVVAAQTKGKLYIESYTERAVIEAIQGIRGLYSKRPVQIPIRDMTAVLDVQPTKKPIQRKEWVRITRGQHSGDLAWVVSVRECGLKCVIQCVPRLDMKLLDMATKEERRSRRKTVHRPPQKFFNPQEVVASTRKVVNRKRFPGLEEIICDYFDGSYFNEGYLLKEVTVGTMIKHCTDDNRPTLDELQRFMNHQQVTNEGSEMAKLMIKKAMETEKKTGVAEKTPARPDDDGGLLVGDTVEVIDGDLVGMRGKLVNFDGSTAKIQLDRPVTGIVGDAQTIEISTDHLRKSITVGTHVKVVDGRYANESGIVNILEEIEGEKNDFAAIILTDVTFKHIKVRTSQLRETAEVSTRLAGNLYGYALYDLVQLCGISSHERGVIVRVGQEDFTVIDNYGIVRRDVRPEALRGKRNRFSYRAVAMDIQSKEIRCNNQVDVVEGPHKSQSGTVKRISGSKLFLYSQTRPDHAGIFVVHSRCCLLVGSTQQQSRRHTTARNVARFPRRPRNSRRWKGDNLVGKTVMIMTGKWKGSLGYVKDANATHAEVELHSPEKIVNVPREQVSVAGDKFGSIGELPSHDDDGETTHGGATPIHIPAVSSPTASDDVWRPGALLGDQDVISNKQLNKFVMMTRQKRKIVLVII